MDVDRNYVVGELLRLGYDQETAERVYDRQIAPQLAVAELRKRGVDVEAALVNVGDDTGGFEITCYGCRRTGRVPFELPEGQAALCPNCQRLIDSPPS